MGPKNDLFILAFDHRGSFCSKLFGIKTEPNAEQTREVASYKQVVFEGFKKALTDGVPKSKAGILVDEQFGAQILSDAQKQGLTYCCPAEKSGQDEFDFEYGKDFSTHIKNIRPSFVKVLVRYNPAMDQALNRRQADRLRRLSEFCHKEHFKFMFELLVPSTENQMLKVGGDTHRFDKELRPGLMIASMSELQSRGIEPDLWKLEGVDKTEDARRVAEQARSGGRNGVGVIVLGRGENDAKVREWLKVAASVPGYVGFAVGRTIFWEPLKGLKESRLTRQQAVDQIAANYLGFVNVWAQARG